VGVLGDAKALPDEGDEETEHQDDPEETELFAHGGEDHVRGDEGDVARLTETESRAGDAPAARENQPRPN